MIALTDEQIREAFAKHFPQLDAELALGENNPAYRLDSIAARHAFQHFRAGAALAATEPSQANARLIADLLEALQLAYRNLNGGPDTLTPMEHDRAFKLARAAIAKAEEA